MWRCESVRRARATLAVLALGLAAACNGDSTGPGDALATGSLDASRVVAVGGGYLAGESNGALYASVQELSVPALFVRHVAPGAEFVQPLISDPGLATADVTRGRFTLITRKPLALARESRGQPLLADLERPYDNLAVPGALVVEAPVAESSSGSVFGNPFYDVILRGRGTAAEQAAELDPSLVLLWIGLQDVLLYVLRGGDPDLAPGLPTTPGSFAAAYGAFVDQIAATTDQIVLFNIPDPTLLPVVHAVPNVVLNAATGDTVFVTVSEPVFDPVTGEQIGSVQRQETVRLLSAEGPLAPTERVTIDAIPFLAQGIGIPTAAGGTGGALPDEVILDDEELGVARTTVAAYNAEIERIAAERGLPVVDVAGLVESLATTGVVSDGVLLTSEWLFGQAFSLDGYSFTPKGYGLVTNVLIDTLNAHYGARLPHIRTADLPGFPLFGF